MDSDNQELSGVQRRGVIAVLAAGMGARLHLAHADALAITDLVSV